MFVCFCVFFFFGREKTLRNSCGKEGTQSKYALTTYPDSRTAHRVTNDVQSVFLYLRVVNQFSSCRSYLIPLCCSPDGSCTSTYCAIWALGPTVNTNSISKARRVTSAANRMASALEWSKETGMERINKLFIRFSCTKMLVKIFRVHK